MWRSHVNAGAGEVLDRIIPEIYNEAMFPGTAMIHSFPSYIYSLWQEYSEDDLKKDCIFSVKKRAFRQQQYTGNIGQKKRRRF